MQTDGTSPDAATWQPLKLSAPTKQPEGCAAGLPCVRHSLNSSMSNSRVLLFPLLLSFLILNKV